MEIGVGHVIPRLPEFGFWQIASTCDGGQAELRLTGPTPPDERRVKTEGLWTKCENCRTTVWKKDLEANWRVCPKCQHHFRLNATQRLELLLDSRWVEYDAM